MSLGSRIREVRIQKGLTQAELGELIGKSKSAINNYENSVRGINSNLLVRIMRALEAEPNYLFQDDHVFYESRMTPKAKTLIHNYVNSDEYTQKGIDSLLELALERAAKEETNKLITRPLYFEVIDFVQDNRYASIGFPLPDTQNNRAATALLIAFDDGMSPTYNIKDCLLIKACSGVSVGHIGIFQTENGYCIR